MSPSHEIDLPTSMPKGICHFSIPREFLECLPCSQLIRLYPLQDRERERKYMVQRVSQTTESMQSSRYSVHRLGTTQGPFNTCAYHHPSQTPNNPKNERRTQNKRKSTKIELVRVSATTFNISHPTTQGNEPAGTKGSRDAELLYIQRWCIFVKCVFSFDSVIDCEGNQHFRDAPRTRNRCQRRERKDGRHSHTYK